MGIWRPTCRLRIQLRLDELDDTIAPAADPGATGPVAETTLAKNQAERRKLYQQRGQLSAPDLQRDLRRLDAERDKIQRVRTKLQERPSGAEEREDDRCLVFETELERAVIERNGVKDASTADITIRHRDLPIDPRCVRSALVVVILGVVSADEHEAGMLRSERREDGTLRSQAKREPRQEELMVSTSRFSGFAEEWHVRHAENGSTITLQCRDVSAVLRDQKLEGKRIDLSKPIAVGVKEFVDSYVASKGMAVHYGWPADPNDPLRLFREDPTGPVPIDSLPNGDSPVPADALPKTAKARSAKLMRARAHAEQNEHAWDHIVGVCFKLGLIPVMRGFALYIVEPRVPYTTAAARRKMVWGRNLKTLEFARKMGAIKSQTIEVRSPDPVIGRTRWARWPVEKGEPSSGILGLAGSPQPRVTRPSDVLPSGDASESVLIQSVKGVTDPKRLETIARNTFESIGRQEIEGMFETDDLESFESTREADLLDLQPADPVDLLVATEPLESEISGEGVPARTEYGEFAAQSIEQRKAGLVALGFTEQTAQRLATVQEQARLTSTFRVGHVVISFDVDDGVTIRGDFHNYIYVRDDVLAKR